MAARSSRLARVRLGSAVLVGALALLGATAGPAAHAAVDCETRAPDTVFDGTSMEFVFAAQGPVGGSAVATVSGLCVAGSAVITELSNDDAVAVDIVGNGTLGAITLTAPAIDFEGIARVDVQIVDGATTFVLELYGLFGVSPTAFGFERPDPVTTAVGEPAFFPLDGITLRDGATLTAELVRSTQPVSVSWVAAPIAGIEVTPPASYRGTIGVEVLLTDGISASRVVVFPWAGVPIPAGAVWAPNPPPVAIEQGGTGLFDLSGSFVPPRSECELRVRAVPDVDVVTEPAPLNGVSFAPIGIRVLGSDFRGLLTVSYDISCRLPDQTRASREYDMLLYVGIPIPDELAATGPSEGAAFLGAGALVLVLAGITLSRWRVTRAR